jgi:two-component system NtrC family sensor kinase
VREDRFDVLLVDMRMPGMDGRAFYEALRDRFPHLAQRVVFATGDSGSDGTSQFLEDAGTPLLGKPYDLRALVEVVTHVARSGGVAA